METVTGIKKKSPSKPWFNNVCEIAPNKKIKARNTWLNDFPTKKKREDTKNLKRQQKKSLEIKT